MEKNSLEKEQKFYGKIEKDGVGSLYRLQDIIWLKTKEVG